MASSPRSLGLLLGLLLVACGGDPAVFPDADLSLDGGGDASAEVSDGGGELDADRLDGGGELSDGGGLSDGGPLDGGPASFGEIVGTCGTVAGELDDATPSFHLLRFDFHADAFDDPEERPLLTDGAQEILAEGTAGGSSGVSEAFAFEVLARCEGASLIKTETEIVYDPVTSKKTDILVSIDGMNVGVSVVRAVSFPATSPYPVTTAAPLVERKLSDILESTMNVIAADAWGKQILVVMAYGDMHAESIRMAWDALDPAIRADTIVYVVVTDGSDDPVYFAP